MGMRHILCTTLLAMTLPLSLKAQGLGCEYPPLSSEASLAIQGESSSHWADNPTAMATNSSEPTGLLAPLTLSTSLDLSSPISYADVEVGREATPSAWKPNSTYALLWSILPGGGQIYNRKYWKVPIVWGALTTALYAINWNQRLYSEYHAAYRDLKSEDPSQNTAWLAFAPRGTKPEDYAQMGQLSSTLQRGNDYFRRYRDLSIVVGVLLYGLSMLDAYVDAELYTFDISPELSMRVSPIVLSPMPSLAPATPSAYQVGLACSLSF